MRAEEYNNWNGKHTRGNQQQNTWYRRIDQLSGRQDSGNHGIRTAKRKNTFKNMSIF